MQKYIEVFRCPTLGCTTFLYILKTGKKLTPWQIKKDYWRRCRAPWYYKLTAIIGLRYSPYLTYRLRRY